jgi:PGF-CTERM protein
MRLVVMKLLICGVICTVFFILIGTVFTASATSITDPTNDVWHWSQTGTSWSWTGNIKNKPNIDITSVSGTTDGVNLTLSITVAGIIQNNQKIEYTAWYNNTYASYYMFWSGTKGFGTITKKGGGNEFVKNLSVSGNTLSAVFKVFGNESTADLWGWAAEYTTTGVNKTVGEWWGDWAPNSKIPFANPGGNPGNNTGGNNTGKKTPGFEVLTVVAAVAVALVLLRRRR